ncbi:ubiquitin carboxyl-terminal hydrolase 31-like [Branchiostoma floridae]|uniref:Ubiquitin carboxyl-terminal hydrolase n=1 Tax=Branchiostoma floridae TaxID=7739 RepID=A0A9J7M6S2_BRAFL|nr:ubiquitin carboxyl-terminal hydrolase 31-like [Branchiostoma floridae]
MSAETQETSEDGKDAAENEDQSSPPRSAEEGASDSEGGFTESPRKPTALSRTPTFSETVSGTESSAPSPTVLLRAKKRMLKRSRPSFRSVGKLVQKMVRHMSLFSQLQSKETSTVGSSSPRESVVSTEDSGTQRNSLIFSGGKLPVPGLSGLRNHGNTCFMNAVLQCLSNTDMLAEYFVLNQYKSDLSRIRRWRDSTRLKPVTRGEVTEDFAKILKALWSCQYTPKLTSDFKNTVSKYASQYSGYNQHDAFEFLLWLLDKVHEDLNCASKRGYKKAKFGHKKTDEHLAAEAQANHQRCNSSFMYDLFQAQYRSSLTCPTCHRQSNTFDPYICISLPLPQRQTRAIYPAVVYHRRKPRLTRIGVSLHQDSCVGDLRRLIADKADIPLNQVVLTEIYFDGFHRSFSDDQPLSVVHDGDCIYAFEAPLEVIDLSCTNDNTPNPDTSDSQDSEQEKLLLLFVNKTGAGKQGKRFGPPSALYVPRNLTFGDLQKVLLHNMADMMREGIRPQGSVRFQMRVVGGLAGKCYLTEDDNMCLYMPTVDKALSSCGTGGTEHLKLVLEWEQETKACLFGNACEEKVEELDSVRQQRTLQQKPLNVTLSDCFKLHTKEEKLGPEDGWHCPFCKKIQHGTTKKLSLWSLPDVLIIQLKRFKQVGMRRMKLYTSVDFPVSNLDMKPHVARRNYGNSGGLGLLTSWSPWRRHQHRTTARHPDYFYDLYAVCNHHGNMTGGHYTAFSKNPVDGRWYKFDDTKVLPVSDEDVQTSDAYILFYQSRSSRMGSLSSTSGSSTCSSLSDHWVNRIPNLLPRSDISSHDDTSDTEHHGGFSSDSRPFVRSVHGMKDHEDHGGFSSDSRPFVRSVHGVSASVRYPSSRSQELLSDGWDSGNYSDSEADKASNMTESRV